MSKRQKESAEIDRLVERSQRSMERAIRREKRTEREWDEIEEDGS